MFVIDGMYGHVDGYELWHTNLSLLLNGFEIAVEHGKKLQRIKFLTLELDFDIQSFDIPRIVSVYPDRSGIRWWTKAWFNNSEKGEAAIEIDRQLAIKFINDNIEKDEWLEEYFPKQMEVYHNAIEQTREQILSQLNL